MANPGTLLDSALAAAGLTDETKSAFWEQSLPQGELLPSYAEYLERVSVDQTVVFYETMSGSRMGDNPFAMFEYLRSHPEYGTFLHVWSLGDDASIPEKYQHAEDVVFARRNSLAYAYFLATAGHVICNANLPVFFTRRSDQRYLNTWHGVAYKGVGRNTPRARFGGAIGTGSFLKATHVVSPCKFMTDIMLSGYSMTDTSTAVIGETGYPRVDLTVNATEAQKAALRAQLGLGDPKDSETKPVVLYAPTWRAESGQDVVDTDQLVSDLQALASIEEITLLYRGHHRMDRIIQDDVVGKQIGPVTIPPHDISSNELLTVVDILITDYSSIFFDFLPTGRPVIHYLYDLEEYQSTRGLSIPAEELPGAVAQSAPELVDAVRTTAEQMKAVDDYSQLPKAPIQGERYQRSQGLYCPHEDGKAAERAVDFFFKDITVGVHVTPSRTGDYTIAFWASSTDEAAKMDSFLQSVAGTHHAAGVRHTLVIDQQQPIERSTSKRLKAIRSRLSTVAFTSRPPVVLTSETDAFEAFSAETFRSLSEVRAYLQAHPIAARVVVREYRRRLDETQFDSVVLGPDLCTLELALASYAEKGQALSLATNPDPGTSASFGDDIGSKSKRSLVRQPKPGEKLRILLLTNRDSDNVGDQLIEASDISLIKAVMKNLDIPSSQYTIVSRATGLIPRDFLNNRDPKLLETARKVISSCDVVLFGGAPLFNYTYQDFYLRTIYTIDLAQEYGVPVLFSSIGVEPFNEANRKSLLLRNALRLPVVRQITTRDDIASVEQYVEGSDIAAAHVSDPAVFADLVFRKTPPPADRTWRSRVPVPVKKLVKRFQGRQVEPVTRAQKEPGARKKKRIGLVVPRSGIFKDNGINFPEAAQKQFWLDTTKLLTEKGYDYRLFTTGHFSDEVFLDHLVRTTKIPQQKAVITLNSPEELNAELKACDGVIAYRLHASIACFAFEVPAIGLSWNFKVPYFYQSVGHAERALPPEQWKADEVVAALEKAMATGVTKDNDFLMSVYTTLFDGLKSIFAPDSPKQAWSHAELSTGMPRYTGTNSTEYAAKVRRKARRSYKSWYKINTQLTKANKRIRALESELEEARGQGSADN